MSAATRSPVSADWRDLASLGEQLASTTSFAAQRDRISHMTSRLLDGNADVWLHEDLFRLPNMTDESLFPARPLSAGMQRALKLGKLCQKRKQETKDHASHGTWVAIPLEDQGMTLGALQVTRPKGPDFKRDELDLQIAETYLHLARQHRSAWTFELDLRAFSDRAWWNH